MALSIAKKNDIVLVAGKGHESFQEINGIKNNFNDFEVIKNIIG
jgi:UDP-N-acetylmuramoyl-L-alanyl-D-glutamate--2,6-diaminopimelate ligase